MVRHLFLRLLLIGAKKEQYGPLPIFANEHNKDGLAPLWVEKVKRALSLIEQSAPWVYRQLLRHVDRILIDDVRGPHYDRLGRLIWLRGPGMHPVEVESVAMTIVHEATHARIAGRNIAYAVGERARHENACCRAEARFAMRLGRPELAEKALVRLDHPWWTDQALRERSLREFDRLGLTDPIGRALRRSIAKHESSDD